ncbi:LPP20 family lipoprotein [Meridianimarinicoccus sp. RP-17]|uniref:LPP20 family lipoprotein n=1 Tax=Meridianimarinicoccus zhengii TaxID=2056810 RepID=UPI0013A6E423|nr:LPP20 family lipoprotein [Phycocomes zhengii]
MSTRRIAGPSSLLGLVLLAAGCMPMHQPATSALPIGADPQTRQLAAMKDDLDSVSPRPGTATVVSQARSVVVELQGLGFAQVARQPGKSLNQKRILAIRAARLDAMRDLTEQVHGLHVSGQTTVRDAVVHDDVLRGVVDGEIRGARTVRITPKGSDSFEVVLALSPDTVRYIARAARR